ncbi:hypothetical protein Q2T83_05550 [Fervidibacter sacchari]|uniref:Uncharacterized protein n=1 Tax=Candidatus Fervidibacter sacchari TaxID=1448929 RepID=A0ABT2EM03_9BACT|nr:hypothetical protein [Candidatus Fervidibacter sacchari]MCS3918977.1 hypothetical protein [Candidatus Fervidibacter sacchari]WKU17286.1 hypothetical protein Q2T83_05550 [Candidatus Fervidibacter sacchari]
MSLRFLWLIGGIVAVALIVSAIWFFYPRPIRSAAPMPKSPQEKKQRWQEAIQKSIQKPPGSPMQPSMPR